MDFSQYKSNAMKKLDEAKSEGLVDEGVIEVLNALIHILIFLLHRVVQEGYNS